VNTTELLQDLMREGLRWASQDFNERFNGKPVQALLNGNRVLTRTAFVKSYKTLPGIMLSVFSGYHFLRMLWGGGETSIYSANPLGLALIGKAGSPADAWKSLQGELRRIGDDHIKAAAHLLGVSEADVRAFWQSTVPAIRLGKGIGKQFAVAC
jgi:hypothetical protein